MINSETHNPLPKSSPEPADLSPVANMSYEEAIAELEQIVKRLEAGEAKLEESAQLYERGLALARHCSAILQEMEERVSQLTLSPEGEIVEKDFELGEE